MCHLLTKDPPKTHFTALQLTSVPVSVYNYIEIRLLLTGVAWNEYPEQAQTAGETGSLGHQSTKKCQTAAAAFGSFNESTDKSAGSLCAAGLGAAEC